MLFVGENRLAEVNADPVISGVAEVGETLTCTTGTWTRNGSFTYQWYRDGVAIGGATSSTYVIAVADLDTDLTCVVTNSSGTGANATATSNTYSPLGAAVPSGAPIVADQTINFGRLTRSGAGGAQLVNTGQPITGTTTNTLTGTNSSHWAISPIGVITPTAAFVASPQASYSLTATVYNDAGSDTATITINTEANAYDAITAAQITAAVSHAESLDNTGTYTVYLRDGTNINSLLGLYSYTFAGTLVDANDGANEASYDYNATASFSGGSCTIKARTAYQAQISQQARNIGSTGIVFDGIVFSRVTTPGSSLSVYQASVERNTSHPAEPKVIFKNCKFGGADHNANYRSWINSLQIVVARDAVVEDCFFNGYYMGVTFLSVERGVARRNQFTQSAGDSIRSFGNATADLANFTLCRREFTSNVIWNPYSASTTHNDGIQIGGTSDEVEQDIFVKRNYYYGNVDTPCQGIFLDDAPVTDINGIIAENFIMVRAPRALTLWRGAVELRYNTCVYNCLIDKLPSGNPNNTAGVYIGSINVDAGHSVNNNIATLLVDSSSGTPIPITDNYFSLDSKVAAADAKSYASNFNGPFTVGTYGPSWTIRTDTAANLVADINTVFAPKAGSNAEGKGHLAA